jgi:molybdopterin synthase sulfur carrier subunit
VSVKVKVPTQLRSLTGGVGEIEASGSDISGLIDNLEAHHPGLRERLLDESGGLRRFVNVYVNDEDVRFLRGLSTPIPEGARVSIIPAVAGGL